MRKKNIATIINSIKKQETEQHPTIGRGRPRRNDKDRFWADKTNFYTTVCFDKKQYDEVVEYAYRNRMSIKEAIFRLIHKGLKL